jgi:hypothetical protein
MLDYKKARTAILDGQIVQGIDGRYQTHVEHGGLHLYRYNHDFNYVETWVPHQLIWRLSKSFHLNYQFVVVKMSKILISPSYGFGYFTENEMRYPECLTDPEIIDMVEQQKPYEEIQSTLDHKYSNGSWGCGHLEIVEVPENCKFIIKQNEGFEHLRIGQRICNGSSNLVTIIDGVQQMPSYFGKLLDKRKVS